ncbi:MAG: aminopeptidase N [Granulosicoccus sp.]|jgi:aminopeptidase N
MDANTPVAIKREDYRASEWSIPHTGLVFELDPTATRVTSELTLVHTNEEEGGLCALTLQGIDCVLASVSVDGIFLDEHAYNVSATELQLTNLPPRCVLSIVTVVNPDANKALEGLYRSSGNFCTQCEAEGFRKITYYLDRPDVLSVFDVEIIADAAEYPVLLSNGNRVSEEDLGNGIQCVKWNDPHPKPSYLFALVAGDLAHIEDHFVTASGRDVLLQIYVQQHNIERCDFAMQSLIASMRWDEDVYGLEYDLDCFMIVAVDDFNMGAMENKGLNVFNSRFVLADSETATDSDYLGVEAVIAHEYFHNWTGNRITCRDWFQLSLKEGLTVFRDQCFSSDMHSATVKRIEDVRLLRARQFPEDAGPMSHPIRPDSYIEINNFYTLTVYEKGAEVIRMLHTLLGAEQWRKGMDEYVLRHDGSATTCDAFIDAMQSVTKLNLEQFRLWYSTAGTPTLAVTENYDAQNRSYSLTVRQSCPDTPGQTAKAALHIPLVLGLLDSAGNDLPIQGRSTEHGVILDVTDHEQTFHFQNITQPPVASLLRGFSAPVKLDHDVSDDTLSFLIAHDSDSFNRWEAGQRLAQRVIIKVMNGESETTAAIGLSQALNALLRDDQLDSAFKAEALSLPTIDTVAEAIDGVSYSALIRAIDSVSEYLAEELFDQLSALVNSGRRTDLPLLDSKAMGLRSLANTALIILSFLPAPRWESFAVDQYEYSSNMTDRLAAFACLCHTTGTARESAVNDFYQSAKSNRLVLDKWFAVQAMSRRSTIIDDVSALLDHPNFDVSNPNRLRSVVGSFAMNNPRGFHYADGAGYRLLADQVIALDKFNPQVAARMVSPLGRWKRLEVESGRLMKSELKRILDSGTLSPDVYELVSKSLS